MEKIIVYTDGSCYVHNRKIGGYGAVLIYKKTIMEIYGGEIYTTNNRMEVKAVIESLKCINTINIPIRIYSDSNYVIKGTNEWINQWIYRDWKNVKNVDLWKELIELVNIQEDIIFRKVTAHKGIYYNERADELASIGVEETKIKFNI